MITSSTPPTAPWAAPFASGPIRATLRLPGSKSITNRALVLAALAERPSVLSQPLVARDTRLMIEALRGLGTQIEILDGEVVITPAALRGPAVLDCGLAGTVMRFVPPVASLADGRIEFDGDPRARERPMGAILSALRDLGVTIDAAADCLPFAIEAAGRVPGGIVTIDASASSQFVSALLLAAPRFERGVDVRHEGKPVPSLPHIDMTVAMLRQRGVVVDDDEPNRWVVRPGSINGLDETIEPDLSNAAPFLAAALVTGGSVTVAGWPASTTQPGDELRSILGLMGADVRLGIDGLTVSGTGHVVGADLDLHGVGELTPVIAAVAAVAQGPSHLRGIAHLRGHETDRLAALATELTALGCEVHVTPDGLHIRPRNLAGGLFHTYDDHRMAHAAAVLGLVVSGLTIENVETTYKTHPDFVGAWMAMSDDRRDVRAKPNDRRDGRAKPNDRRDGRAKPNDRRDGRAKPT